MLRPPSQTSIPLPAARRTRRRTEMTDTTVMRELHVRTELKFKSMEGAFVGGARKIAECVRGGFPTGPIVQGQLFQVSAVNSNRLLVGLDVKLKSGDNGRFPFLQQMSIARSV